MAKPDEAEIRHFLNEHIRLWNLHDREAFTALYKRYARDGLVIEYVGVPIGDGWEAFNYMWDTYNANVRGDINVILVNGNEGVAHYSNVAMDTGKSDPSVEIYKFDEGRLHIRYFHNTDSLL